MAAEMNLNEREGPLPRVVFLPSMTIPATVVPLVLGIVSHVGVVAVVVIHVRGTAREGHPHVLERGNTSRDPKLL
jgi:hypothetical protein